MALERASVFENVKWGVEALSAPGTQVAANKQLEALGVSAKPSIATKRFRPSGKKFDTTLVPGKDYTTLKLTGVLDYSNIIYALASNISQPTISTVGTNGRTWDFSSNVDSFDTPQTYTLDIGSPIRAGRVTGAICDELQLTFKRDSVDVAGSFIAQQYQDNVNPTGNAVYTVSFTGTVSGGTWDFTYSTQTATIPYNATANAAQALIGALSTVGGGNVYVTGGPGPASYVIQFVGALGNQVIAGTPTVSGTNLTGTTPGVALATTQAGVAVTTQKAANVFPGGVDIFVDATSAGLGTTKLLRVLQADWKMSGRWSPLWAINSQNASYAATVEKAPDVTLKLKMVADGAGMAYLAAMRAASVPTYFFQISVTGAAMPAPDQAHNYAFTLQMAGQVESPDDMGDTDGAETVDWTFRCVPDATWGRALRVQVTNLQTAL